MGSMGDGGLIMTLYDGTMEAIERIFFEFLLFFSEKIVFKSNFDKYFMECEHFWLFIFYGPWRNN